MLEGNIIDFEVLHVALKIYKNISFFNFPHIEIALLSAVLFLTFLERLRRHHLCDKLVVANIIATTSITGSALLPALDKKYSSFIHHDYCPRGGH